MASENSDFASIKLDDGFDAMPKQDAPRKIGTGEIHYGELVPDPPRWMNHEQRHEYYAKDLFAFLGDDAGGAEEHPAPANFKRKSRPEPPPRPEKKPYDPNHQGVLW